VDEETGEMVCTMPGDICEDYESKCFDWAEEGECENNSAYMHENCRLSCGTCRTEDLQNMSFGEEQNGFDEKVQQAIEEMRTYMMDTVFTDQTYRAVRSGCVNKHEDCVFWATEDECENNPEYMHMNCGPACRTCMKLDISTRCPMPTDNSLDVYKPGDLDKMFERIAAGDWDAYGPKILAAPVDVSNNPRAVENVLTDAPWIITLDRFVTDEEADRLIELGHDEGYERSKDVGERLPDGTYGEDENEGRTSENAWCVGECFKDPLVKSISEKITNVTGIPDENSENLQILKYELNQYYESHHDYIEYQQKRPCGPRVLTFFLYLSDVEEGGGTKFNDLDLIVEPKKGKALLWPSVLNEDPNEKDFRTHHEAMPVIKGRKFATNAWLHLREFKQNNSNNCA